MQMHSKLNNFPVHAIEHTTSYTPAELPQSVERRAWAVSYAPESKSAEQTAPSPSHPGETEICKASRHISQVNLWRLPGFKLACAL